MRFDLVPPRSSADVALLYVEARVAGLEVSHYPKKTCHTYDGLPEPGATLGVFRHVGNLIWHKGERRWEVRACCDCSPVALATLIEMGLSAVRDYGRSPGNRTRRRCFEHKISSRTGEPIACAGVSYRLDADDLLGHAEESVTVEIPSTPVGIGTAST